MHVNRRRFFELTAGAGALSILSGCHSKGGGSIGMIAGPSPKPSALRMPPKVTVEELDKAAEKPVLQLDGLSSPVVIQSIELLRKDREYYVRVRSKDGAEGVAVINERAPYLYPILNKLVIPYFIGKDARDLETHLFEVYRYQSNYKLQGLALWCPVAWVEFALLDMMGRISGKSLGQLLGGVVRREVPFYVASGRRDSTPQEEVEYLASLVKESGAKAVKFRVGGRMSKNADAMPGRTETLIPLARKTLGDAIDIHADSNSSYDPPKAIEVGRMLEDIGAVYFEEPCPFDNLEDTKKGHRCFDDTGGRRRAGIQSVPFPLDDLQSRRGHCPAGPALLRRIDPQHARRADGCLSGDADDGPHFGRLRVYLYAALCLAHAGRGPVSGIQDEHRKIRSVVRSAVENQ